MSLLKKITKLLFAMMIISPVYVFCADPEIDPGLPPEPTNEATVNVEVLSQLNCMILPTNNSASNATDLVLVAGTNRQSTEFPSGRIHPTYSLIVKGTLDMPITVNFNADMADAGRMYYTDEDEYVKATVEWHEGFVGQDYLTTSIWETGLYGPTGVTNEGSSLAFMVIKKIEAVEGTPPGHYVIPFTVSVYYTGF